MKKIWNQITEYADKVSNDEIHGFDALIEYKEIEAALKKLEEVAKKKSLEEMEGYSDKERPTRNGFEFHIMNATSLSYKNCPTIVAMSNNLKMLKEQAKLGVKQFLDEESGEVYELVKPIKKQTEYVKMTKARV